MQLPNACFGRLLKFLRTSKDLSLKKLEKKTGLHFSTISYWERTLFNYKELPITSLEKLALGLGISFPELCKLAEDSHLNEVIETMAKKDE